MTPPTLEDYLAQVGSHVDSGYGAMVRQQFRDHRGSSERALLVAPNAEEFAELQRAVAIMTAKEKARAARLSDEEVRQLAADARVNAANLAIFFNGYAIHCKNVSCSPE